MPTAYAGGRIVGSFNKPAKPSYSVYTATRPTGRRGQCFWCNGHEKLTRDHLIPSWARRLLPRTPELEEIVGACGKCNNAKGATPPAIFWAVRRDPRLVKQQAAKWTTLSSLAAGGPANRRYPTEAFVGFVAAEMLRRFPRQRDVAEPSPPADELARYVWLDNWPNVSVPEEPEPPPSSCQPAMR